MASQVTHRYRSVHQAADLGGVAFAQRAAKHREVLQRKGQVAGCLRPCPSQVELRGREGCPKRAPADKLAALPLLSTDTNLRKGKHRAAVHGAAASHNAVACVLCVRVGCGGGTVGTRKTDTGHQQHVDCFKLKVALDTLVPRRSPEAPGLLLLKISMAPHPCRPTKDLLLFHAKVGAAVLHQHARLAETAGIK